MTRTLLAILLVTMGIRLSHLSTTIEKPTKSLTLFDFGNVRDLSKDWSELSDTVRAEGKSKASFDVYKTSKAQSAILFTLVNPQPNGAGFCGVRTTRQQLNLNGYDYIHFVCRPKGNATRYKIVLRHNNENNEPHPSFEQQFQVTLDTENTVELPLKKFKPYYRGKPLDDGPTLNVENITAFGIQVAGGVYDTFKQSGLSSLELDRISVRANPDETSQN
ncbi:uncharacterized protein LOC126842444 isoform X2 [Adelges cooleyi]|nr:uncharacterized protein LOC126842444 isoform X2 [Adelges cooleyi]XP_050435419.1 uncharacterized protein LOC126842444 isoform X2 [Adelges cooleyi]